MDCKIGKKIFHVGSLLIKTQFPGSINTGHDGLLIGIKNRNDADVVYFFILPNFGRHLKTVTFTDMCVKHWCHCVFQAWGLPEVQTCNTGSVNTHTGRLEQGVSSFFCYLWILFYMTFVPSSHFYSNCLPVFQVLVPLLLLQALQREGQSLTTLFHLGVRFLEEEQASYIIQQGGWVSGRKPLCSSILY